MASILRSVSRTYIYFNARRPSSRCFLKANERFASKSSFENNPNFRQVKETQDGDVTVVEGVYQEAGSNFVDAVHSGACPICSRNLKIHYTDVLILSQFVRDDGSVLPRRITGVCYKQQKVISKCVDQAQKAGLLPMPDMKYLKAPPLKMNLPQGIFHTYYVKQKKRLIP